MPGPPALAQDALVVDRRQPPAAPAWQAPAWRAVCPGQEERGSGKRHAATGAARPSPHQNRVPKLEREELRSVVVLLANRLREIDRQRAERRQPREADTSGDAQAVAVVEGRPVDVDVAQRAGVDEGAPEDRAARRAGPSGKRTSAEPV